MAAFVPLLAGVRCVRAVPRRAPMRMCASLSGRDVIARTARLAHLRLSDDEIDQLAPDFQKMLGFVDKMNAIDLNDDAPVSASPLENVLREDVPRTFPHMYVIAPCRRPAAQPALSRVQFAPAATIFFERRRTSRTIFSSCRKSLQIERTARSAAGRRCSSLNFKIYGATVSFTYSPVLRRLQRARRGGRAGTGMVP